MIGGNVNATIQIFSGSTKNAIGEVISAWTDKQTIRGFIDLMSGDSKYSNDSKMQESTHIFVCDYVALDSTIKAENSRMVVNGKTYDILLIDDPMELHKQLEIYLKFLGG